MDEQLELGFRQGDGVGAWRRQREESLNQLARHLGLPLGHPVEVWLKDGVRLQGRMHLRRELLMVPEERDFELELEVDGVVFRAKDIESCVRTDVG